MTLLKFELEQPWKFHLICKDAGVEICAFHFHSLSYLAGWTCRYIEGEKNLQLRPFRFLRKLMYEIRYLCKTCLAHPLFITCIRLQRLSLQRGSKVIVDAHIKFISSGLEILLFVFASLLLTHPRLHYVLLGERARANLVTPHTNIGGCEACQNLHC